MVADSPKDAAVQSDDWYDPRFDPYLVAVGRISGMFAQLEFNVNQALWEFANVEAGAGACITTQIASVGARLRALIALVDYRGGSRELLKVYGKLSDDIDDLSRQRNRFIHDPVSIVVETGKLKRAHMTADKRLKFEFVDADLAEMDKLHRKIRTKSIEFTALHERALAELPPWPRKQFEQSPHGIRSERLRKDNTH